MIKDKIIDTIITGSTGLILINWTAEIPIETIYQLFVQSLVATATIGKLLYDVLKSKKNRPD